MAQSLDIVGGPSKYDLMLALFDRSANRSRPVTFSGKLVVGTAGSGSGSGVTWEPMFGKPVAKLEIHILGVSLEDGSGESYCFTGQSEDGRHWKGWYRTDDRHGRMEAHAPS